MKLEEVKSLLEEHNIPFEQHEYQNEKEYMEQMTQFAGPKMRKDKVVALVIRSRNGKKDIGLQFNCENREYIFCDLYFGSVCYELFDYTDEWLGNELIEQVAGIMRGEICCIVKVDLNKKRWCADAVYDMTEDEEEFENALRRIEKRKGLLAKLLNSKMQYEIYDWNTYRCIVK